MSSIGVMIGAYHALVDSDLTRDEIAAETEELGTGFEEAPPGMGDLGGGLRCGWT